ncbi:MAG: globin [Pseudomonadota bacterium]
MADLKIEQELALIEASLAAAGELGGDITATVFTEFYARDAAAAEVMQHADEHMQGRMFGGVVELLLEDKHLQPGGYLEWELENHLLAYGAEASMYQSFFDALLTVVEHVTGTAWQADWSRAWQNRMTRIMAQVNAFDENRLAN